MDRVLDRRETGVRPPLSGAEDLFAALPVSRSVPGAHERRAHAAGIRRQRQRPLEEGDRLAGLPGGQLDRAEPKERERGAGIEAEGFPIGLPGARPVAEFLAQLAKQDEARRIARMFLDARGEDSRRFRGFGAATRVSQQVAGAEPGDITLGQEQQRLAITRSRLPDQPVGVERLRVFQPDGGVFRT